MVIERNRWVRRFLVAQPALIWPLSFVLWSTGDDLALAAAVLLLWISAAITVAAILRPMHTGSRPFEDQRTPCR
ncbi:hypothetical protein [Saccharopolyspora griseoalba]|uniref:Uncharacterized protein n=1 Tax=Saccharopolyspora griseoalba TaxID=1431848 RepID=A0ABW2LHK9_9PSEU